MTWLGKFKIVFIVDSNVLEKVTHLESCTGFQRGKRSQSYLNFGSDSKKVKIIKTKKQKLVGPYNNI